ncbi:MAG: hypothetical protein HY868_25615 [Chloroflexi bacterium]|nr:hypothetical protein [Chloroflexota bacterium]
MEETKLAQPTPAAPTQIALIAQELRHLSDAIARFETKLFGNGKPGLIDEVNAIKNHVGYAAGKPSIPEELNAIKAHIGFSSGKTIDDRVSRLETMAAAVLFVLSPIAAKAAVDIYQMFVNVAQHVK